MIRPGRLVTIAVLLLASISLGTASLFLDWWTLDFEDPGEGDAGRIFSARPFHTEFVEPTNEARHGDVLDREALVAGVVLSVALAVLALAAALVIRQILGRPSARLLVGSVMAAAALVGLTMTLAASLSWPDAWKKGMTETLGPDAGEFALTVKPVWWGDESIGDVEGDQATLVYAPDWGWFAAIAGFAILPAAATGLALLPWKPHRPLAAAPAGEDVRRTQASPNRRADP